VGRRVTEWLRFSYNAGEESSASLTGRVRFVSLQTCGSKKNRLLKEAEEGGLLGQRRRGHLVIDLIMEAAQKINIGWAEGRLAILDETIVPVDFGRVNPRSYDKQGQ